MPCRDELQGREGHKVEFQRKLPLYLLALLGRDPVPLVDRDDQGTAALQSYAEHAGILLRNRIMRVQYQHYDMGLCNGLQGLDDAGPLDDVLDLGTPTQPGSVDEQEVTVVAVKGNEDAVARRAWLIVRDNTLFAQETVDQR